MIENPMSLENKRIMITGASSGIGKAIAIQCSKLGADVIIVSRTVKKLEQTLSMLEKGNHRLLSFDLFNIQNIKELMDLCISDGIKLDGFVHSAGILPIIPIANINYEKMLETMKINYFSFMEITKQYSKRKYSNGGSIVAISSVSSFVGWKGASVYCGSKGALDSSVRALSLELAPKGIRVNTVVPSNIKTEMFDAVQKLSGNESQELIVDKQPLGLGKSEDVANAVAFLLSDASRFITGTSLVVDGGYLAQ